MPATVTIRYLNREDAAQVATSSCALPWDLVGPGLSDDEDRRRASILCRAARCDLPDRLELDEVGDFDERESQLEVWVRVVSDAPSRGVCLPCEESPRAGQTDDIDRD